MTKTLAIEVASDDCVSVSRDGGPMLEDYRDKWEWEFEGVRLLVEWTGFGWLFRASKESS